MRSNKIFFKGFCTKKACNWIYLKGKRWGVDAVVHRIPLICLNTYNK